MEALNDAYEKLSSLSDERAQQVVSLIEDLSDLEARENNEDLSIANAVLANIAEGEKTHSWEDVKARLDGLPD